MAPFNSGLVQQMGLQSILQRPAAMDDPLQGLRALEDRFNTNSNNEDALFPIEQSNPYGDGGHGMTAPKPDTNLDWGPAGPGSSGPFRPAMSQMGPGMAPGMGMGPQGPQGGGLDKGMMAQVLIDRLKKRSAMSQAAQGPQSPIGAPMGGMPQKPPMM